VKSRLRRIFRNTASAVSGWAAARRRNGSGAIVSDRRYPRSTSAYRLSAAKSRVGEQVPQHAVLVIEVEPVGPVVDDADGVSLGEVGRKLKGGHIEAGEVPGPTAGGLPGERGFLPVPVVGVEPFLGLGGRQDQFVAAEELHERRPVLPHLFPALLDL